MAAMYVYVYKLSTSRKHVIQLLIIKTDILRQTRIRNEFNSTSRVVPNKWGHDDITSHV